MNETDLLETPQPEDEIVKPQPETTSAEVEDEGPVEYPEDLAASLEAIQTSMEWLQALKESVERYGVSRGDMQSLLEIRASLEEQGVVFDPTPSLEAYPLGSYLEDRSGLNLNPAQESITATVVQTLKAWWRKVVEYVSRFVRWVKGLVRNEANQQRKLDALLKVIHKVRETCKEIEAKHFSLPEDLQKALQEYRQGLLQDGSLEKTNLQLAALGDPDRQFQVRALNEDSEKAALALVLMVKELSETLEIDAGVDQVMARIADLRLKVEELNQINPLFDQEALGLETTLFGETYTRRIQKVMPYNHLTGIHGKLESYLKKTRQFEGDIDTEGLFKLLTELTQSVESIALLIQLFHNYNQRQLVGLNLVYKYENQRLSQLVMGALTQSKDEETRRRIETIKKNLQAFVTTAFRL